MRKFSNTYIFLYVSALVLLICVVLASVSIGLKSKRDANVTCEKYQQILKAAGYKDVAKKNTVSFFQEIAKPDKGDQTSEQYRIRCADGNPGIVLHVQGKGLWGPIWGYVVLSEDGSTIKGVAFAHKSETPGLGAKITDDDFANAFIGKKLYDQNGVFTSVRVVKKGQEGDIREENRVDAISGATITSRGVDNMMKELKMGNVEREMGN